jgi:ferredoxin
MQEKCGLKLLAAQVSVFLYAVLRFAAGALAMFNATCLHHHQDICHAVTFRAFVVVYDLETARRIIQFLIGQDRSVPKLRQANHCIQCGQCQPHCPQSIRIPQELQRIDEFVEKLKQEG